MNIGTFALKAVIRSVMGVFGHSQREINIIASYIDVDKHNNFTDVYNDVKEFKEFMDKHTHIMESCIKLEGRKRNQSTHAGGVVITYPYKIGEIAPVMSNFEYKNPRVIGYTKKYLEKLGLIIAPL